MTTAAATADAQSGVNLTRRMHVGEAAFSVGLQAASLVVLVTLGAILIILFQAGYGAFQKYGIEFIWSGAWDPPRELYGALPAIVGTLTSSALALIIAWPTGFGIAYFLTEYCPRPMRGPLGIAVELLAAVPSIVYGMWGFFVLAPFLAATVQPWLTEVFAFLPNIDATDTSNGFYWFSAPPLGVGLFTSAIVLAIMILPFIAAATRDVLKSTPQLLRDGGYAMGSTRWETMTGIVIPAVRGSLFGAVFLGLGRALGETMAVTFVIGNANRVPDSFYAPAASIASIVANEFPDAEQGSIKMAVLFALGFLLFVVSFFVLMLARLLLRQGRMAS